MSELGSLRARIEALELENAQLKDALRELDPDSGGEGEEALGQLSSGKIPKEFLRFGRDALFLYCYTFAEREALVKAKELAAGDFVSVKESGKSYIFNGTEFLELLV